MILIWPILSPSFIFHSRHNWSNLNKLNCGFASGCVHTNDFICHATSDWAMSSLKTWQPIINNNIFFSSIPLFWAPRTAQYKPWNVTASVWWSSHWLVVPTWLHTSYLKDTCLTSLMWQRWAVFRWKRSTRWRLDDFASIVVFGVNAALQSGFAEIFLFFPPVLAWSTKKYTFDTVNSGLSC